MLITIKEKNRGEIVGEEFQELTVVGNVMRIDFKDKTLLEIDLNNIEVLFITED